MKFFNPSDIRFNEKLPIMVSTDPGQLTSSVEQVSHSLEGYGCHIQHLQITPSDIDHDPEENPGSIGSIYDNLMATLPDGLGLEQARAKAHVMKEIAIDVGLSNVGILKAKRAEPAPLNGSELVQTSDSAAVPSTSDSDLPDIAELSQEIIPEPTLPKTMDSSLSALRTFLSLDPSIALSEPAKYLLDKWCVVTETDLTLAPIIAPKRKRVKVDSVGMATSQANVEHTALMSSQGDSIMQITMSQPERGIHGTRTLRKRPRKSGF
jgi:hypothetical protein